MGNVDRVVGFTGAEDFLLNTCFFNLFVMVIVSPLEGPCKFDHLSVTNGLRYDTHYWFSYEILHQRGVYFTICKTQNINCGCTCDARHLTVYQIIIVVQTIGISTQYSDTPVKPILLFPDSYGLLFSNLQYIISANWWMMSDGTMARTILLRLEIYHHLCIS